MSVVAWRAINTFLHVSVDAGTTWHKIAACQDFNGPKLSRDTIDVTTHDVTDSYKRFLASLKDSKELTFQLVFDPTDNGHGETVPYGFKALFESGDTVMWKLVWPVSPKKRLAFDGFVTGCEFTSKVRDALMANGTIKIDGASLIEAGGDPSLD